MCFGCFNVVWPCSESKSWVFSEFKFKFLICQCWPRCLGKNDCYRVIWACESRRAHSFDLLSGSILRETRRAKTKATWTGHDATVAVACTTQGDKGHLAECEWCRCCDVVIQIGRWAVHSSRWPHYWSSRGCSHGSGPNWEESPAKVGLSNGGEPCSVQRQLKRGWFFCTSVQRRFNQEGAEWCYDVLQCRRGRWWSGTWI